MKLSTILDQIDMGSLALPVFQRGYVWTGDQVRRLLKSLYQGFPVGSLLVWRTRSENVAVRGGNPPESGTVDLLLDGQQRITSLYGVVRGRAPTFFEGNERAFLSLHFHLEKEEFEFYGPIKMRNDPYWVDVTELMKHGIASLVASLNQREIPREKFSNYIDRANRLVNIREREFHIELVTGDDKTVETVADIFNQVNSGGTKLNQADLALARVCSIWTQGREVMNRKLEKWSSAGYTSFDLRWYMRCINALNGNSEYGALKRVEAETFARDVEKVAHHIDSILNVIASRLGLDHSRVLPSEGALPLMVRYMELNEGRFPTRQDRDELLYWYVFAALLGRYSGSVESVLSQDLAAISNNHDRFQALLDNLRRLRPELKVTPRDFVGHSVNARFYFVLYMLTRVGGSQDWETGVELRSSLLGRQNRLELHHIFPKARLSSMKRERRDINALANLTFLTAETNNQISDKEPFEYLAEIADRFPGALESHWIPMRPELWQYDRYDEFLEERRKLLANATNDFLSSLYQGEFAETELTIASSVQMPTLDEESAILDATDAWLEEHGFSRGNRRHEIIGEAGEILATLDSAWIEGIQSGITQPVALLIDEDESIQNLAASRGFLCFTDVDSLKSYVLNEILGKTEHSISKATTAHAQSHHPTP